MDIREITNPQRPSQQVITDLKRKTIAPPEWSKLRKEYETREHPVMTDPFYQDKPRKNGKGTERMSRITLDWMKLAVKRMASLLFGIPVLRVYNDHDNEQEKLAAQILEAVYAKNRINAVNKKRARFLYASCEIATIWYTQEQPTTYAGQPCDLKLRCRTFSPFSDKTKGSESIYPLFDEYDDLVALSMEYERTENGASVRYFETYTIDEHIRWRNTAGIPEEVLREDFDIEKLPGLYAMRPEPIWEDRADNVHEVEWNLSRNGNYIRKNSRPTWVVATDDDVEVGQEANGDNESRNVLKYPADAKYGYATWPQAIESLKFHIDEIKRDFFMSLQLPDMSMDNMKATPMSGEARKMVFIDARMKAEDESDIWLELFDRETNVLKAYLKKMYPELADAFDALEVEHRITPYQINDDGEKLSNISTATGGKRFMSQRTAIKEAGYVDDIDAELEAIQEEEAADVTAPSF